MKIGRGSRLSVLGFGHNLGSIREMMGETSVPCSVGAVPSVQAVQLPYQLLQFLVFALAWMVLESNGLGFDFLCRAARSFAFVVGVA